MSMRHRLDALQAFSEFKPTFTTAAEKMVLMAFMGGM
jgi:hypothetical protein